MGLKLPKVTLEACQRHLGWPSSTRVENGSRRFPTEFKKVVDEKIKLEKWIRKSQIASATSQPWLESQL
jgi:hypothetical protein